MISSIENQYVPDRVSPPRDTLRELIEERGMSQTELAKRMGKTLKAVNEILSESAGVSITSDTALQLEQALGLPARFWLSREQAYQEARARLREREQHEKEIGWLDCLPLAEMRKRGIISKPRKTAETVREALAFFKVVSVDSWRLFWSNTEVAYHISSAFDSELGHLATWLRCGEIAAAKLACAPYDVKAFEAILPEVRALSAQSWDQIVSNLVGLCASAGVAVAFIPEFPKTHVCGAARWLNGGALPIILLSLRYKTDDHFRFTFFHEACHILKHAKKAIYVDDKDPSGARIEEEANRFSRNFLIPPREYDAFIREFEDRGQTKPAIISKAAIKAFADHVKVSPGVVVGRLQCDGWLPHSHCNDLKVRLDFA